MASPCKYLTKQDVIIFRIDPLHVAAACNLCEKADYLIECGDRDVNVRDAGGKSPLHYAARYNHLEMVDLLCTSGAHVNAKNNHGQTPLHYAFQAYAVDAVKVLRFRGASTKIRDNNGVVPAATPRLRMKNKRAIPLLAGLDELVK